MDLQSWRASERATHYQEQADKLRSLATLELAVKARGRLLALADEYQQLADTLGAVPVVGEAG